jgi:iron complex outermembrane receptor protein
VPPFRVFTRILSLLVLAAAAARGEGPGESIEVVGQRPTTSVNAPAAQGTSIDTAQFGGEVRSVSELLLAAPGVTVHPLGGPGQASTLSLRGATADESLVLLDGIPLQGPGGGSIDLSTLPATLLSRLVVTRGVLGAQLGAGALGGAVELFPKPPQEKASAGAQISAGSFGAAQLALDGSMPFNGGGSGLIAVQADRVAGDFDYSRQLTPDIARSPWTTFTRENADARRLSGLARATQPLGSDLDLSAIALGTFGDRGLPGSAAAPTPLSREQDQGAIAGLRLRGTTQSVEWAARAWGRVDRIELQCLPPAQGSQAVSPCFPEDQRSTGARGQGEIGLPLGDRQFFRATLEGGSEWIHGSGTGAHQRGIAALALADDLQIARQLAIHPALRLERIGSDTGLSPALTASFRPVAPVELRAGFGHSFRAPSFSELYLDQGGVNPNPDLRPERAWSADAGVTWHSQALLLSAGVFYTRYSNVIVYEFFPPAAVKPFNVGQAHISGLELEASVPLPQGFLAQLAYSYLDAIDDAPGAEQGHHLAYRPPHRLFTRLARSGDRLEGYGELGFVSAMPRNAFDSASQSAQLVLSAGAGARVAGPLWLDVEAKNLLNDQTLEDQFQYPLPGLSIAVIARARL